MTSTMVLIMKPTHICYIIFYLFYKYGVFYIMFFKTITLSLKNVRLKIIVLQETVLIRKSDNVLNMRNKVLLRETKN